MSEPPETPTLSEPDPKTLLAVGTHVERLRALRALGEDRTPALVEALRRCAHEELRRDPQEARRIARLGAVAARSIGDDPGFRGCRRAEGQAAALAGEFRSSARALRGALAVTPVPEIRTRAELEALLLTPLVHLELYEEAEAIGRRAREAFERLGDAMGAVRVHMALADLAFRQDRHREALDHYLAVERLVPEPSPRLRAILASNRANSLEARHRLRAAARQFELAREIFDETGFEHTVAQVEYNTGYAEACRGRYEDALRRFARIEEVFIRLEDERHLAHLDLDRAEIHVRLHLPADARLYAAGAETRFLELGLEKEAAQAMLWAGRAAELAGEAEDADRAFLRAEEVYRRLDLPARRGACLAQRARLAEQDGRLEEARGLAACAEAFLNGGSDALTTASLELLRARLKLAEGCAEEALRGALRVLGDRRRIHAPWIDIEAHRTAGQARVRLGRLDAAVASYRGAIERLEEYRGGVPPDEYMTAFLAGRSALYEEIVDLLLQRGDAELALEFVERSKSRALVDLLATRLESQERSGRSGPLTRRLRHMRERLNVVYQKLFRNADGHESRSARAVREAQDQARTLEQEITRLQRRLGFEDREAMAFRAVEAPDLREIRRELEPDETLIEYFLTSDSLTAFVVTREEIHAVRRGVGSAVLRPLLSKFHFHLGQHERPSVAHPELQLRATRANLEKIADVVLAPIANRLRGRRLVVVPHGVLHHLPFHALPWGEGWVADRFETVYAPSAAVYAFCGRRKPEAEGPAALFGLPDELAPAIEWETRRVAGTLATDRVYLHEDATFERLRHEAGRSRILHIATHGMFRHAQPMMSGIRLADGWVNLYDIYGLDVRGDLVVLSSCESGTAGVSDGDEILGLTRGFLYAGAPALLTSQWRVHDATTLEFMDAFYAALRERGDAAAAHHEAMASVRVAHPHPYHWAPFFLTGRPVVRAPVEIPEMPAGIEESELCAIGAGDVFEGRSA